MSPFCKLIAHLLSLAVRVVEQCIDPFKMKSASYKHYLLTILLIIQGSNYLDGTVLGLVLQNIKADLHLTDTQLGFLGGLSFAIFYFL